MAAIQQGGASVTGNYWRGTSTRNNHGTAINVGSFSAKLSNKTLGSDRVAGVFGSTPYDGNNADKAVSGGTFAHNHVSPIVMKVTTEIAGVASDALRTTSNQPGLMRSIHKLEVLRTNKITSAVRSNKFNRFTGMWDAGYPQTAVDSLATDTAATPTRSSPGQLTYKLGQPVPVTNNDYKAKTA